MLIPSLLRNTMSNILPRDIVMLVVSVSLVVLGVLGLEGRLTRPVFFFVLMVLMVITAFLAGRTSRDLW